MNGEIANKSLENTQILPVGYKKIFAWQLADLFANKVYLLTAKFPKDELYGVISQLRRAALSVSLNIIEGYARNNKNEFCHFLRIALGSLAEAGYLLEFSLGQRYLGRDDFNDVDNLRNRCGGVLWKLYRSQLKKN